MNRLLLALLAVILCETASAQLLTWTPPFPKEADPAQTLVITADAAKGNQGLYNYTPANDVYVHLGVITTLSANSDDWKYVKTTWPGTDALYNAPSAGTNKWSFTISGSLRNYFGLTNTSETILKIAILFRSGNGSKVLRNADASNMYIPVYSNALAVRIDQPAKEPKFIPTPEPQNWTVGTAFTINARSNNTANLKLYHNGVQIASANNAQTITGNSTVTVTGNQQLVAEANDGTTTKYDTLNINVAGATPVAALPAGVQDGINYTSTTSVTLVLRAPGKNQVFVLGDFNSWTQSNGYLMNKTPDGNFFWVTINGLTPGTEYGFQYIVDGSIKIADPYAEKILDPGNDGAISSAVYPGLKPYPAGQTGMVSVLQTAAPAYNWAVANFNQPSQKGLVIYELHLRDFISAHNYKTLKDTISYLKRLGINAVELMPVTEFEGNSSWGYNTFQYFAPDKYYGPKNTLKEFIDSCHKAGIAVILDMVLNHTYGPSPLKDLYGLANNPWYNATAPHAAINFGDDFNHESANTRYFFNRVLQHWMTEYKADGYRLDFSKGLTQKSTSTDAAFSAYDASRIAILKGYFNTVKAVDPDAYVILEHFADNTEEKELSDAGFMLWANVWTQYQEASMGYIGNSNLDWGVYTSRGWTNPHLVTFMESHDEERVTFKNEKYGNSSGGYNIRDTATALKRMELNAAFLLTIPGPKMIWEFGELGYDYSRCYLSSNNDESGTCDKKLDPKPVHWDYQADPRRKSVFNVYSQLNRLRFHTWYGGAFQTGTIDKSLAGSVKWIKVTTPGDTADVVVVGNFDVTTQTATVTFPTTGTWYDYLNNSLFTVSAPTQTINLAPGQYFVYINRNVNNTVGTAVSNLTSASASFMASVYPNPIKNNVSLEVNVPGAALTTIDVFSSTGQKLQSDERRLVTGSNKLALQTASLKSGVYYLRIQNKWGNRTVSVTKQ